MALRLEYLGRSEHRCGTDGNGVIVVLLFRLSRGSKGGADVMWGPDAGTDAERR